MDITHTLIYNRSSYTQATHTHTLIYNKSSYTQASQTWIHGYTYTHTQQKLGVGGLEEVGVGGGLEEVGVGVGIDSQLLGRSSRRPGAAGLRERAREDRRSSDQLELGGGLREQGRTEPGGGGLSEVGDCGSKGGPAIIYKDSCYSRARIQNFRTPAL